MTKYFPSLPHDSAEEPTMEDMDPAEPQEIMAEVGAFNTAVQEAGAVVTAGGLHPPSTATTVDYTGDAPVLTPGPFIEAKEYLGGFWIIEAETTTGGQGGSSGPLPPHSDDPGRDVHGCHVRPMGDPDPHVLFVGVLPYDTDAMEFRAANRESGAPQYLPHVAFDPHGSPQRRTVNAGPAAAMPEPTDPSTGSQRRFNRWPVSCATCP